MPIIYEELPEGSFYFAVIFSIFIENIKFLNGCEMK